MVLVSTVLAALVLLVGAGPLGATPPTEDGPTAARYGAAWLAAELDAGIPMVNFGSPDWGVTLDAALALAASGTGGAQLEAVWAALEADPDAAVTLGGMDAPGRLARAILLAEVMGEDARAVGAGAGVDLIARLEATRRTSGPDTGLYGASTPLYDGAFRQGYALAALVAAGVAPDPTAVQWLLDQQCTGADAGAWMPHRSDLAQPCAFDGSLFVGPDTNATAAAITGLAAVGGHGAPIDAALAWLDQAQTAEGGWEQLSGFGTDPNSTALVLQALLAVDAADDERYQDRAATPLQALLSFQLGCDALAGDEGAFTFPGSNDAPNGFATAQAVPAAAGAAAVFEPGAITPGVTPLDCGPATTSTTTTASTTTTGAPTTAAPSTDAPTTSAGPSSSTPTEVADLSAGRGGGSGTVSSATGSSGSGAGLALTGGGSVAAASTGALLVAAGIALLLTRRRHGAPGT
jgi:hypothetical protein